MVSANNRKDWRDTLVSSSDSIEDVLRVISRGRLKIALVIDEERHLLGTATDGDLRRALLAHHSMTTPIEVVMNKDPVRADLNSSKQELINLMRHESIEHLPLTAPDGKLANFVTLSDLMLGKEIAQSGPQTALLMAGGFGKRLQPLTNRIPKPLVKVGTKPIVQYIVEGLQNAGFGRVIVSLHYKGEMIRKFLGSGEQFGVQIEYLEEETPLGTAGCLGSVSPKLDEESLLVMNADLLTGVDYRALMNAHDAEKSAVTFCVRPYQVVIPFGVFTNTAADGALFIEEKPTKTFNVNAGIYVFSRATLAAVEPDENLSMPELINRLHQQGRPISLYPIVEDWLDIGTPDSLMEARAQMEVQDI